MGEEHVELRGKQELKSWENSFKALVMAFERCSRDALTGGLLSYQPGNKVQPVKMMFDKTST